jgi:hypothetical protein
MRTLVGFYTAQHGQAVLDRYVTVKRS